MSSSDGIHRPLGLDELGVVDAVPGFLFRHRRADELRNLGVGGARAERPLEISFPRREETGPQLSVGRHSDPVAGEAEGLGDAGDEADVSLPVLETKHARGIGKRPVCRQLQRPPGMNPLQDLPRRNDLVARPEAVAVESIGSGEPVVRYRHDGEARELRCDFVAGCDGFHGIAHQSIPKDAIREYVHDYPFGWVGVLAQVAPSTKELIYARHEQGFALHTMRSSELSRLYLQCDPGDVIENWPDRRIWDELHARLEMEGWSLNEGPIVEKAITPMRAYVTEPMQYGRLFLAGDAAHIVPPTGAKGLNLAVADVRVLARALVDSFSSGDGRGLERYSEVCLRRVWKVQGFSWWMTSMLHNFPNDEDGVQGRLQLAQLDYVTSSRAAATSLAEQYTGLPFEE